MTGDEALNFSMVFRVLIMLIIEATFLTCVFCPMRDFSQAKGGHGPMVNTPLCVMTCLPTSA